MATIARTPAQIGAAIRRTREAKKLTQSALADLAGTKQGLISQIERGHPGTRLETVCNVMAALELDMSLTMRGSGKSKSIEDVF